MPGAPQHYCYASAYYTQPRTRVLARIVRGGRWYAQARRPAALGGGMVYLGAFRSDEEVGGRASSARWEGRGLSARQLRCADRRVGALFFSCNNKRQTVQRTAARPFPKLSSLSLRLSCAC